MSDTFGSASAFLSLAAIATIGLVVVSTLMPETRPPPSGLEEAQAGAD